MLDFPNTPTVGQTFNVGTAAWRWDGVKWVASPGSIVATGGTSSETLADRFGQIPNFVSDFGAAGDGVTDDAAAIQAGLTAMAGRTICTGSYKYYIGSSITVPAGTTIQGPYASIGFLAASVATPFPNYPSWRLSSTATITLGFSAAIQGVLLYRAGMTFPAANSSAYAGTAITVAGDYVSIRDCLIMGFAQAITSNNFGTGRIAFNNFDNQANILIQNSLDTWTIAHNHAFPFGVYTPTVSAAALQRSGAHIIIRAGNAATKIIGDLCYGYSKGYVFDNQSGASCIDCAADNTGLQTGSHAFEITGAASAAVTLISPHAYLHDVGIYRSDTGGAGSGLTAIGAVVAGNSTGILLDTGTNTITRLYGSDISGNGTEAIRINSATAILDIDGCRAESNGGSAVINLTVPSSNLNIGANNRFSDLSAGLGTVAVGTNYSPAFPINTGSTLHLPAVGSVFGVGGGLTISDIDGQWGGRMVTFIFGGVTTFVHTPSGTPTKMQLRGGANYVSALQTTLTLVNFGNSEWCEVSRQ